MVHDKLLLLRERSGLSQQEISLRLGIARTTYASYEQGAREPDIEMLKKLAAFHDVKPSFLIDEEEDEKRNAMALPDNKIELFIREREEKYGVTIKDDPIFQAALRNLIDSIAQTKADQQNSHNPE